LHYVYPQHKLHKLMNTDDKLRALYNTIRLKDEDIEPATLLRDQIVAQIKSTSGGVFSAITVGSFAKGTKIMAPNEFDMLVECNVSAILTNEAETLKIISTNNDVIDSSAWLHGLADVVAKALNELGFSYSMTTKSVAVTVKIHGVNIAFDFIPMILTDNGCTLIPDGSNTVSWKHNFSAQDCIDIAQHDEDYPDYKMVICLLKFLRTSFDWNVTSYTVECLVFHYTQTLKPATWRDMSISTKIVNILLYFERFIRKRKLPARYYTAENLLSWLSDADVSQITNDIEYFVALLIRNE
jgi:hypothetical protein